MSEQLNIFDRLLLLPLFQGMNSTDLGLVAGQTKFGFHHHEQGKTIISEGDVCDHLCFLMKGTLEVTATASDHGYMFSEFIQAPDILQPEHIFGLNQHYTRSFTTVTPCNIMTLDKSEVMMLTDEYLVFRLNLLNIISTQSQRQQRRLWHTPPVDLRQRIARFFESHCLKPAGPKTIHIKMTRLAEELNDSRLDISVALHEMQDKGLVVLKRGCIEIPDLRLLLS